MLCHNTTVRNSVDTTHIVPPPPPGGGGATGEIMNTFKILTFEKFVTYCLGGFGADVRIMIR
jgi:hypothetical protein